MRLLSGVKIFNRKLPDKSEKFTVTAIKIYYNKTPVYRPVGGRAIFNKKILPNSFKIDYLSR